MTRTSLTGLFVFAALLPLGGATPAEDEKKPAPTGVEEAFKRFAAAVKDDNYQEAAKYIAHPADKIWTNVAALRPAAAKYHAALDGQFGKSDASVFPFPMSREKKGDLAEHFYEVQGEVREAKEAGKDQAHVVVWTKRPDWRDKSEVALYERKFTATKAGDGWKFHLHGFGGTPVLKKVKRTTPEGKEVEVYAEHDPNGSANEKDWKELPPICYEAPADYVPPESRFLAKCAEIFQAQTEQVKKGAYKTRDEAQKELREQVNMAFRESQSRSE
jgi:hypothetical protein